MDFCTSFSYSIKRFSPLVLEPNTSIQKESLLRVLKRDFLSFPPPSLSLFSHTTLELSIAISTYRDLCCERILDDQRVVITKVLLCTLRRRTCGFAVFQVLV